ncbi:MAG: InlB B-repeat-containing protein, partial [Clostridia bacterium]|nr:InlB B-repeat-containing protein [Clostridia bacterium]
MDKTNIRKILTSVLAVLLIFSMFSETAFALSGDGSHIGHTGGGSSVSGAYLVPSSNSDHHVGFRFTWLTLGTDGYYSRKAALDVFYKGYNPNSSWGYHIKATVNGTTYRNLSKYEYKRYYDSLTIDREYYSTSTAYKYCNRTDIPVTLPADEDAMTTWGKKEANMNIILNKMVSGATVANMKSSDYIFIEPLYRVKIENTNYCITVTEMGLIGCVVCSATSTGNEGSGYGSGWVTIRRYTNLNWPDALKTDSAHAGISAGTTLSSATSFQNLVNKGYGLMVVWNTNPHLLTVYYTTGTGDASLKISSSYKLASNFTSYSSSYIRNSSDNYFTQSVYYDNNLTLMNGAGSGFKMTRDYYTFSKWQKNGTTSYFNGGSTHKASTLNSNVATGNTDVTFTAVWTPKEYTITYNLNGGKIGTSSTNPTQKYTYETDVYIGNYSSGASAYATPSKDGYDFSGWKYTAATIGYWTKDSVYANRYNKGQYEHGDITLYAQWTPKSYTVTYNANGGSGAPGSQTKTYGNDLTLSSTKPTRNGYTFVSWNTKADGKGTTYASGGKYTGNANLTLYAIWNPITYSVKYNGNGATSGSMSNQSHTYDTSKNLTANAFKRAFTVTYNYNGNGQSNSTATANATFGGWATSASGSKAYNDKQSVKNLSSTQGATVNLYAKWTDASVTLPSPTRTGYVLNGWYTAASGGTKIGNGGASYTPTGNITLYAQWSPISYTVKFNGNGSTAGSMSNQGFTFDKEQNLTANAFTRAFVVTYNYNGNGSANSSATANATFNGWATSASGAKTYTDKQSVKNLSSTQGATVNLYAKWTDGSVTLPTPTRTGYTLKGWYTAASSGTKVGDGGAKYTPSTNVTLYAQWTPITYSVKFNG